MQGFALIYLQKCDIVMKIEILQLNEFSEVIYEIGFYEISKRKGKGGDV